MVRARWRILTSSMLLLSLLVVGTFVHVPNASAAATVCKAAVNLSIPQPDLICMTVGGKDGTVTNVDITGIVLSKNIRVNVCDYKTEIRISNATKTYPGFTKNSGGRYGCSINWADLNVPIHQTYPIGSYICAKFFVQDQQVAAEQCVKLTKSWW